MRPGNESCSVAAAATGDQSRAAMHSRTPKHGELALGSDVRSCTVFEQQGHNAARNRRPPLPQKSAFSTCNFVLVCLFAATVFLVYWALVMQERTSHYVQPRLKAPAGLMPSRGGTLLPLPVQPPSPYEYEAFMDWFRGTNWSTVKGLKWIPEVSEFDVELAAKTGKFAPWLTGKDISAVKNVMKSVNRLVFLEESMLTGDLTTSAGPAPHLYILHKLISAASGRNNATFLDAGCGTGFMLLAWVLLAGEGSRAIGIDVDPDTIESARRHMLNPNVVTPRARHVLRSVSVKVHIGDALDPVGSTASANEPLGLTAGSVDAINVGLAVSGLEALTPLAQLLRAGGQLVAPVCRPPAEQPPDIPSGKCAALLEFFEKANDGSLQRELHDPDIKVTFIVARHAAVELAAAGAVPASAPANAPAANLRGR